MIEFKYKVSGLLLYPSLMDLFIIVVLYIAGKKYNISFGWLTTIILAIGFFRYLAFVISFKFRNLCNSNFYIKTTIILLVTISLLFLYEYKTFTWVFSIYYVEMTLFELIHSFYAKKK